MSFTLILTVSSLAIGGFICAYFAFKSPRLPGDAPVMVLLGLLALPAILTHVMPQFFPQPGKHLFLRGIVPLIFSPALYWYANSLLSSRYRTSWRAIWHTVPLLVALCVLCSPWVAITPGAMPPPDSPLPPARPIFLIWAQFLTTVSFVYYAAKILRQIREYRSRSLDYFSFNTGEISLRWLVVLVSGFAIIHGALLLALLLSVSGIKLSWLHPALAMEAGYNLLLVLFGYFTLNQERVFFRYRYLAEEKAPANSQPTQEAEAATVAASTAADAPIGKYLKSGLNDENLQRIFAKIEQQMHEHALYRNNTLTLEDLAERTGISRHYLSHAINRCAGRNFFAYINQYRVNAVIRALQQVPTPNRPLLELAMEAGFSSKSSFINRFKETTGKTPQQFRSGVLEAQKAVVV